ncbi:hypothetical protein DWB58_27015, partial [candidate division KSB1 bacterium]|nr:hypothetical protein [candidate division KSB1 bacterium]
MSTLLIKIKLPALLILSFFLLSDGFPQTKPDSAGNALIFVRNGKMVSAASAGVNIKTAKTRAELETAARQALENLRQKRFYFARIDSAISIKTAKNNADVIHFYLNSGPEFDLTTQISLSDSSIPQQDWQRELRGAHDETAWLARLNNVLTGLAREGHPLAFFTVDSVTVQEDSNKNSRLALLHLKLEPGPTVRLDSILIRGNKITKANVLLRELPVMPGDKFNLDEVESIPDRLLRLGFLKSVSPPQLHVDNRGRYLLDLAVVEG